MLHRRDVVIDTHQPHDAPGGIAQRHLGRQHPAFAAIGVADAGFAVDCRDLLFDHAVIFGAESRGNVDGEEIEVGFVQHIGFGSDAEKSLDGAVDQHEAATLVLDVYLIGQRSSPRPKQVMLADSRRDSFVMRQKPLSSLPVL